MTKQQRELERRWHNEADAYADKAIGGEGVGIFEYDTLPCSSLAHYPGSSIGSSTFCTPAQANKVLLWLCEYYPELCELVEWSS